MEKELYVKIKKAYKEAPLADRERRILEFRLGLDDGVRHTLAETGKLFGLTRERIRQIELKAIGRMRAEGWI